MPLPLRHLQVVIQLPPEGTPMPCFTSDIRSPAICIMGIRFNAKQVPAANPGMSALVTDTSNGTPSTCLTPAQVQVTLTSASLRTPQVFLWTSQAAFSTDTSFVVMWPG